MAAAAAAAASLWFPLAQSRCIATSSKIRRDLLPSSCCSLRGKDSVIGVLSVKTPSSVFVTRAVLSGDYGEQALGYESLDSTKTALYQALEGVNKGIFGITSAKRSEIHGLVELLELQNPTPEPTGKLRDKVDGCWKLIYSTISILGAKRTKLGLRDFISLGDFFQIIDVTKEKAVNVIKFNARGLKILSGQLTIEASYKITTKARVDIKLESSTITPGQLMTIFQKNYDLLLAIFNPEGWLEITYPFDVRDTTSFHPVYKITNIIFCLSCSYRELSKWTQRFSLNIRLDMLMNPYGSEGTTRTIFSCWKEQSNHKFENF